MCFLGLQSVPALHPEHPRLSSFVASFCYDLEHDMYWAGAQCTHDCLSLTGEDPASPIGLEMAASAYHTM